MEDFGKLFDAFSGMRIGIVGDLMLDTYMWGRVDRVSPEAPVPVVVLDHKEFRAGGAGNVALNCRSLGANVSLFSVCGNDEDARLLLDLLNAQQVQTGGVIKSSERITTSKTRIISRNQQMLRLDAEMTTSVSARDEAALLAKLNDFVADESPAVIIFEDYNKGVLTDKLIREMISLCRKSGVITAVDPKRQHFFSYAGADIFKPNMKEVKEALNLLVDEVTPGVFEKIHNELHLQLGHNISFITLSDKGVYYQQDDQGGIIPSHLRNIADVSGAGDTVIAVASMVYAATRNILLMAEVANIAGGLVCEEVGTVPISAQKLQHECEVLLS